MNIDEMKTCGGCLQAKPITDFYVYKKNRQGPTSHCKLCMNKDRTERYRKEHPRIKRPTVLDRFLAKIIKTDNCWLWMGCKLPKQKNRPGGYGYFSHNNKNVYAHRFAYELWVGPIPPNMTIDHLCFTPSCVNPSHMEIVTLAENTRRGNFHNQKVKIENKKVIF
jgi:hypothetical protein